MPDVKFVVVGDAGVGKTSLIISYQTGCFPYENIPEVIGMYDKIASYEDWSYPANLTIWDTASAAEYDVMRPLAYQDAHAIIICFSTVDPDSYYSVASKWWPEVYNKAYGVPIILVGTKIDVRMNTPVERPRISYEQGQQLASDIGASEFAECSALTHEGRDYIFYRAVEVGAPHITGASEGYSSGDSGCCVIL